jgi:hypothetical protein
MKAITADNYLIRPFVTNKTQTYSYKYLGTNNPPQITIDVALKPDTEPWFWSDSNEPQNNDGTYMRNLYVSTRNLFDNFFDRQVNVSNTGSDYFVNEYFNINAFTVSYFGNVADLQNRHLSPPTASLRTGYFDKKYFDKNIFNTRYFSEPKLIAVSTSSVPAYFSNTYFQQNMFSPEYFAEQSELQISGAVSYDGAISLYVVNVAQQSYGNKIRPHSIRIEGHDGTSIVDDGLGGLVLEGTLQIIGSVLYSLGIIVILNANGSDQTSVFGTQGMILRANKEIVFVYDATSVIYEHMIICTMDIGEMNFSTNPSMGDVSVLTGTKPINDYAENNLSVYMTTVGIYTDSGELVAIGKLPRPLKRAVNSQQTIILRFDA